ncbi:MAG TPA: hypothetical protein VK144_06710 [Bacillota bacterium]|nr:hypothetical protein [Bacillota bacterium]
MSIWFGINVFILVFVLWKVLAGTLSIHILFGASAFFVLLYNFTRHAFFATIRSNIKRSIKIKFAHISKRVLPYHKWTGSLAFFLMVIHASIIIHKFGFHQSSFKMMTGIFAALIFFAVVLFGWLRWYRTTVFRRYAHWILAFFLLFAALIHIAI